jgi:alpha-mannosidase
MVYDDAEKIYARVGKDGKALLEAAFKALIPKSVAVSLEEPLQSTNNGKIIAYNSTPFPRLDVVQIPLGGSGGAKLRSEAVQVAKDGKTGFVLVDGIAGPGLAQARGLFADVQPASGTEAKIYDALLWLTWHPCSPCRR